MRSSTVNMVIAKKKSRHISKPLLRINDERMAVSHNFFGFKIEKMNGSTVSLAKKVGIATAALAVLLIFWRFWWVPQQQNVNYLKYQISIFNQQIKGLSTTVDSKQQLEQQLTIFKQQLQGLPANLASKQQLEQQLSVLEKQVDALPDELLLEKQLDLEKNRLFLEKDKINLQNSIYTSLIQALGGIFFFVTAYLSWRNLQATEDKQITERFSRAVEQLSSNKIEVRLGGIYSLERIAKDSSEDHWTIMEVLTSFVQEKSSLSISDQKKKGTLAERFLTKNEESATQEHDLPKVSKDIKAAMIVIGRRDAQKDPPDKKKVLELNSTNLTQVDLTEAYLRGANLEGAHLEGAHLEGAHLERAHLEGAHLERAHLEGAHLEGAHLKGAHLEGAHLEGAHLEGAHLWMAYLEETHFNRADLRGADLRGADLNKACFNYAKLEGIRYGGAKNLPYDWQK